VPLTLTLSGRLGLLGGDGRGHVTRIVVACDEQHQAAGQKWHEHDPERLRESLTGVRGDRALRVRRHARPAERVGDDAEQQWSRRLPGLAQERAHALGTSPQP